LQVSDLYNKTYANVQADSIYKQGIPLANLNPRPGECQTYDVVWIAPRFNDDGSVKTPAYVINCESLAGFRPSRGPFPKPNAI
jgi:hypothetical protein